MKLIMTFHDASLIFMKIINNVINIINCWKSQ